MDTLTLKFVVGPASAGQGTPGRLKPAPQRGAALFIALISLLALTFTGLALVRAMDAAGLIAGNFSFRQAALSVADIGLEGALKDLETIYISGGRDNSYPSTCKGANGVLDTNCRYYAWYPDPNVSATTIHCTSGTNCDTNGVSQRIDWTSANLPTTDINFVALGSGYSYQYVIERLCDATHSATDVGPADVDSACFSMSLIALGNSQESKSALLGSVVLANEVAYRATIRINGPRNTSTMVQAILMKN